MRHEIVSFLFFEPFKTSKQNKTYYLAGCTKQAMVLGVWHSDCSFQTTDLERSFTRSCCWVPQATWPCSKSFDFQESLWLCEHLNSLSTNPSICLFLLLLACLSWPDFFVHVLKRHQCNILWLILWLSGKKRTITCSKKINFHSLKENHVSRHSV